MKQRLVVMNGQCMVQIQQGSEWKVQKMLKAGELRPGIYNLYLAQPAEKAERHEGLVLHVDATHVYQAVGKRYVMHDLADFEKAPEARVTRTITYDEAGKAQVSDQVQKLSRSRSR